MDEREAMLRPDTPAQVSASVILAPPPGLWKNTRLDGTGVNESLMGGIAPVLILAGNESGLALRRAALDHWAGRRWR